jgi:hypothetical protein
MIISATSLLDPNIPKIPPAFQWAQSSTDVLLNVKFSHKIDAPATLNVEPVNVTITDNYLYLHASDGTKHFGLELNLFSNIIANESTYSMASVGRMTFQLKKQNGPIKWPKLITKASSSKKYKMHMWIEMQEKYANEVDKLENAKDINSKPVEPKNDQTAIDENVKVDNSNSGSGNNNEATPVNSNSNTTINDVAVDVESNTTTTDGPKPDSTSSGIYNPELKAKIKELDDERKKKRKEVDVRARAEKETIDKEIASRKQALLQSWNVTSDPVETTNAGGSEINSVVIE